MQAQMPCPLRGYPDPKRLTSAVRKLATLKQFALLIAVNPFGTGCGKKGRKSKTNSEQIESATE